MYTPLFAPHWRSSMNEYMNKLIHDFMYKNVAKYSWHILNIVKKQEDNLYVRVASGISYKTADCNIHIYSNENKAGAAYNFVLCLRDNDGNNDGTIVCVLDKVADAARVLDCLLAANDFDKD